MHGAIASGGMATVHYGRMRGPRGFSRAVAIKRLHPELAGDAELAEALAAEARLCARIRHPNVVSVLDVVEHERGLLLVMELVSAVPLSVLVRRAREQGKRVPPAVAVAIVSAVLRGLAAAHELGVVHRDVSPQNVLVGADGVPKLVDFGIAKIESQGTRGASLKGKPGYMAPEQLLSEPVDRSADVYAAAVVLWELLTGARLFAGESDHAVMLKVLERRVDAPGRIVPGLPAGLDRVTLRGLARDRAERFASAAAMANELEGAVAPASTSEVGSFVADLCGDDLAELQRQAAALEEHESPVAASRGNGRLVLAALAVLLAIAAGGALWLRPKGGAAALTEPAQPSTTPQSSTALLATGSVDAAPPSSVKAASPAPSVRKLAKKPAPPDCDPPYVIDAQGYQRMKPECL